MRRQSDTNPHFVRPFQNQDQQHSQPSGPLVPPSQHHDPGYYEQPQGPGWLPPLDPEQQQQFPARVGESTRPRKTRNQPPGTGVSFKPKPDYEPDQHHPRPKRQPKHSQPPSPIVQTSPHPDQDQHHPRPKHEDQHSQPPSLLVPINTNHDHDQHPQHGSHGGNSQGHPRHHSQSPQSHPHSLHIPHPQETNLFTWSAAIFCAIFWVVIIIGGLVVLIVYLVFRPRTPKFDISASTLNAAYLDMGYLLNADLTLLANFTNPNKKVSVDFSYMTIDLYYGNTLIATQYIEPFSAHKRKSMFANIHMVASQVRLGMLESQRLKRQLENNRAQFEVKGFFRARSNFGSILRYSYWMHSDCKVVFTRPPEGILVGRKCRTKP